MTRRRFFVLSALVLVVGLAVGMWLLWPRTAITRENAAKIREGMTLAEVEAILGGPARDEAGGALVADSTPEEARGETARLFANPGVDVIGFRHPLTASSTGRRLIWASDCAVVHVHLDGANRVASCDVLAVQGAGPIDLLRRWLGL